ncbi:MAG TPA: flagellar basal body rod protein FlgG [Holosporales bacterium]|nr:flagellar basal body rod protein FlgG [Holosporales bacterium]
MLNSALQVAVSGLKAAEGRLHTTASNLAALNAISGKKSHLLITDRTYRNLVTPGASTSESGTINPTGYQLGTGVQIVGNYQSFSQGTRIDTGRALDVFIDGDGFFPVILPDGTQSYSRVGNLQVDNTGRLVMPGTGYVLEPSITFPEDTIDIDISATGEVSVTTTGGTQSSIGQLQLTTFLNPSGLKYIGSGMYQKSNASGEPVTGTPGSGRRGGLIQKTHEGSNIQAVDEMVELVQIEKDYNAITKVLKTGEKMWEASNAIA